MMGEFSSPVVGKGTRLQSGIPSRPRMDGGNAQGLMLRGVIVAVYVLDDENHPMADSSDTSPRALYCDVLTYGRRHFPIRRVLVTQDRGAMHSGRVWKPRAATLDTTGNAMNLNQGTNPANLDGDHVIVSFIDGNFNQPFILRELPHPQADQGNDDKDAGHRMRLKLVDGDPDFWKHHGAFYGVSDDGDFTVDLTEAWAGEELGEDGSEPGVAGDGSTGNYQVMMPAGSTFTIELGGGDMITIEEKDGNAKLKLGDGAVSAAIAEHIETLYGNLKSHVDGHSHTYIAGVSPYALANQQTSAPESPPLTPDPAPPWDSNIASTKLKFPDG